MTSSHLAPNSNLEKSSSSIKYPVSSIQYLILNPQFPITNSTYLSETLATMFLADNAKNVLYPPHQSAILFHQSLFPI
jgi:hypothetical protein